MEEAAQSGIPVLFCHVPTEGRPYAINEMTDVLLRVAMLMVDIMCKGSRQNREDMTRIDRLDDQEELRATCYGSRVP
jgi:hypothetical protein